MDHADCEDLRRIRVLVALEVYVLQEGLASALCRWPEIAIIDQPLLRDPLMAAAEVGPVDVVLLDATHSNGALAHRIQRIRTKFAGARVVVIGVPETAAEILGCIESGASGYTLEDSPMAQLVETIQTVHRGEASCPPNILALLFERMASLKLHLNSVGSSELSKLTGREIEVLQLVSEGMSNREISATLHLELQTVKNYVHSILEKLKVQNRRQAAVYLSSEASRLGKSHSASIAAT